LIAGNRGPETEVATVCETRETLESVWKELWEPMLAPGGVVDLELLKRELFNYYILMDQVTELYDTLNGMRR